MDMGDKERLEQEKRSDNGLMHYNSQISSSDWRFGGANLANSSMGFVPTGDLMPTSRVDVVGTSRWSTSMSDTFGSALRNHHVNLHNLGYCDVNVQNTEGSSDIIGIAKGHPTSLRGGVAWHPLSSVMKDGVLLPNAPGLLQHSFSRFPVDSGFVDRAARLSCFKGGNFSDLLNPYTTDSMVSYSTGFNSVSGGLSHKNELNACEASKDVSLLVEHGATEGGLLKNEKSESLVRSHDEVKECVVGSGNESNEDGSSGGGGRGQDYRSMLEDDAGEPSLKEFEVNKRKRGGQYTKHDQTKKTSDQTGEVALVITKTQKKGVQHPTSTTKRMIGKHEKQGSRDSTPSKDEYIHVRARRGQATNSHSLAERVRREKISERMKLLQDLVPGCNKVTGKAVMLDEIINYVQSLQRQVEFLSMKLATVNPQLDFNIEELMTKDAEPSSTLGFPPDMPMLFPPSVASRPAPHGMVASSSILSRTINPQLTSTAGGFKDSSHVSNMWDNELHNLFQMSFETNATP